eukprot:gene13537-22202_t
MEGWTYWESVWFCVVTMTTIGFGDFTPNTYVEFYIHSMCFVFIIPGLGLGAAALGTLWDVFEARRYWCLQTGFRKGRMSAKLLEAHGIRRWPPACGQLPQGGWRS